MRPGRDVQGSVCAHPCSSEPREMPLSTPWHWTVFQWPTVWMRMEVSGSPKEYYLRLPQRILFSVGFQFFYDADHGSWPMHGRGTTGLPQPTLAQQPPMLPGRTGCRKSCLYVWVLFWPFFHVQAIAEEHGSLQPAIEPWPQAWTAGHMSSPSAHEGVRTQCNSGLRRWRRKPSSYFYKLGQFKSKHVSAHGVAVHHVSLPLRVPQTGRAVWLAAAMQGQRQQGSFLVLAARGWATLACRERPSNRAAHSNHGPGAALRRRARKVRDRGSAPPGGDSCSCPKPASLDEFSLPMFMVRSPPARAWHQARAPSGPCGGLYAPPAGGWFAGVLVRVRWMWSV